MPSKHGDGYNRLMDMDDVAKWMVRGIFAFFVAFFMFVIMQFWSYYDWHIYLIRFVKTWDWKDWLLSSGFLFLLAFLGLWLSSRKFKKVLKDLLHIGG